MSTVFKHLNIVTNIIKDASLSILIHYQLFCQKYDQTKFNNQLQLGISKHEFVSYNYAI